MEFKLSDIPEAFEAFTKSLDSRRITVCALLFSSLISPGVLTLALFKREILFQVELWRLLGFCSSTAIPSIIACTGLVFLSTGVKIGDEEQQKKSWVFGCGLSSGIWHGCLLYALIGATHFTSILELIRFVAIMHVLVCLVFCAVGYSTIRKSRKRRIERDGDSTVVAAMPLAEK